MNRVGKLLAVHAVLRDRVPDDPDPLLKETAIDIQFVGV